MLKIVADKRLFLGCVGSLCRRIRKYSADPAQSKVDDSPDFVESFLKNNPNLTANNLNVFIESLGESGVSIDLVPGILKNCPDLVKIPPGRLKESLGFLIDINLGPVFNELIVSDPSVLYLSKKHLMSRYRVLAENFGEKSIPKIFVTSPSVLTESPDDIVLKANYLVKELLYTEEEVIKTGALGRSLKHIKRRIEFMRKAGVFKVPKAKTAVTDKLANPRLGKILNSDDHEFATQIVGVSLLEFDIFVDIMTKEEDSDDEGEDSAAIDDT